MAIFICILLKLKARLVAGIRKDPNGFMKAVGQPGAFLFYGGYYGM